MLFFSNLQSVFCAVYTGFLDHWNLLPPYDWNVVKGGVKNTKSLPQPNYFKVHIRVNLHIFHVPLNCHKIYLKFDLNVVQLASNVIFSYLITRSYRAHLVMSMMIDIGVFFMVRLDFLLYQENLSIFPRDMCLLRMTRYSQLFVRCHEKYDHIMLH
jgi:hypothetical protein